MSLRGNGVLVIFSVVEKSTVIVVHRYTENILRFHWELPLSILLLLLHALKEIRMRDLLSGS